MEHANSEASEAPEAVDRGQYPDAVTPWDRVDWRSDVHDWVAERLAVQGMRGAGRWSVRVRPWSVLARIPVEGGGRVWFKANPPAGAFEGPLASVLADLVPDHVLTPLAVDERRGWSLLPEGGELLRDVLARNPDDAPDAWAALLRQYAEMQRALLPHTAQLEARGVPSARTVELPELFDRLVEESATLLPDERRRLAGLRPQLAERCEELAAVGVPDALDHSDLHDGQVFRPAAGWFTFFDWGDAAVSHPFCSFLVPARTVRDQYGPDSLPGLRDAYLEPWTAMGATAKELRRALSLACHLAALGRAASWTRMFPSPSSSPSAGEGVPGGRESGLWLMELLTDPEF
ncbi:phosphotransferase [uncultured Streptomyces sp.]|uniref:phosphotransferase n=1 Tax=uncultured Streptomyces sp. TaxID=174707 RepID=UPI0026302553|nr:phosphotransferase [uncultured Streptomyces sp.]